MKRSLKSFKRRYLTRRNVDAPDTALFWWGSYGYSGGPTIGDLMAVENLSAELTSSGVENRIVTHPELGAVGHLAADDIYALKAVRKLVFVCGPITRNRELRDLIAVQKNARKLAVGVSVLANQAEAKGWFDQIVARDGLEPSYFDLAPKSFVEPNFDAGFGRVGICLRGSQGEYGRAQPEFSERARLLLTDLAQDRERVVIDTVLSKNNSRNSIDEAFARCDMVLTTRMHGGLLALAHGKPVIAVDQIAGGAKVKAVVGKTGWSSVFEARSVTIDRLRDEFAMLQGAKTVELVETAQRQMARLTQNALDASVEAIKRI